MRRTAAIVALALAGLPAGALAAKPSHPTTPANTNANTNASGTTTTTAAPANAKGKSAKVMFVIHGTVAGFAAVNGQTNGWIRVTFKSSNFESSLLKGASPVQFVVSPGTKVTLHEGKPIANGDRVVVKLRAAKNAPLATLTSTAASQVVDQGSSS